MLKGGSIGILAPGRSEPDRHRKTASAGACCPAKCAAPSAFPAKHRLIIHHTGAEISQDVYRRGALSHKSWGRMIRSLIKHVSGPGMSRILLAEDDNDMRRFLVRALQNAGYDVASFDNGQTAYERLREEPFDLLLTDIVMPEMDGIELARRATELDPDIKVMFITGFAAVALNPDSNAPKDAKILSKPFHLKDLVNEVKKLVQAAA
jgi:two-component system, cell cycle response regulator CpdR